MGKTWYYVIQTTQMVILKGRTAIRFDDGFYATKQNIILLFCIYRDKNRCFPNNILFLVYFYQTYDYIYDKLVPKNIKNY
jgi:hypothetical protein